MENSLSDSIAIILAGGRSSRAEMPKGLRTYSGEYWINHILSGYLSLGVRRVYIGLGYDSDKYVTVLPDDGRVEFFINSSPENGSFSTLHHVFSKLRYIKFYNAFIHPLDTPFPQKKTLKSLAESMTDISKPCFHNICGHPISINAKVVSSLRSESLKTSRLDIELRKRTDFKTSYIDVEDSLITYNLNTEEDWNTFLVQSKV